VAKTATEVAISQGAGVNLSNFALASGRRRQTVIIGDADDSGEALVAELPAHDAPDRGSPLKIGGRASQNAFTPVADGDRVDAWFGPQGHLGVINTTEPAYVYDGGRRTVSFQSSPTTHVPQQFIAGTVGMRTKLLSVMVICSNFTTAGTCYLTDGNGGPVILYIARVLAVGQFPVLTTGLLVAQSSVPSTSAASTCGLSASCGMRMQSIWRLAASQ